MKFFQNKTISRGFLKLFFYLKLSRERHTPKLRQKMMLWKNFKHNSLVWRYAKHRYIMLWPFYSLESELLNRWWPYSYDYAIWSNKKWCFYFGLSISTLFSSSAFNCSFLFWSQNSLWVIWCVIWLTTCLPWLIIT